MNLILKSSTSAFMLADVGVIIDASPTGSDFSNIPALIKMLGQSTELRPLVADGSVVVNDGSTDLGTTDGQRYLNKIWLQSGHDTAVQMTQVEGEITDSQHGIRGGGTLHAVATQSVTGFMSTTDKTKLDGIIDGAVPSVQWSLGDNNGPGSTAGTGTPTILRYGVFVGTDFWTPDTFTVLADTSNASRTVAVDIYDITNGLLMGTISGIAATTPTLYSTSTLTNLPATTATIALRAYYEGQSSTATVFAAYFYPTA